MAGVGMEYLRRLLSPAAPSAAADELLALLSLAVRVYRATIDETTLDPGWTRLMTDAGRFVSRPATVAGLPVSVTVFVPDHGGYPSIKFRACTGNAAPLFGMLERPPGGWRYVKGVYSASPEVLVQTMQAVMARKGAAR